MTLKEYIKGRSITLVDLSAETGLSISILSKIQNSKSPISVKTRHRLADAGIEIDNNPLNSYEIKIRDLEDQLAAERQYAMKLEKKLNELQEAKKMIFYIKKLDENHTVTLDRKRNKR